MAIFQTAKQSEDIDKRKKRKTLKTAGSSEGEEAPIFISSLTGPTSVEDGQSVHLECRVIPVNDKGLTIHWYRNGTKITPG